MGLRGRALAVLFGTLVAVPGEAAPPTPDELAACLKKNLPQTTALQSLHFRVADRTGEGIEIQSKLWWRRFDDGRSRAMLRVLAPPDYRGSALLLIERKSGSDMFLFLPELGKPRRMTSQAFSGSLFGSDFTYEDFQQVMGVQRGGSSVSLPAEELDGMPVHVLEQHPDPEQGSAYERIVTYVTHEPCVPVKTELYEAGGRLRKVLRTDVTKLLELDGLRLPGSLRMEDLLNQSSTVLEIDEVVLGSELPRRLFDASALERSGRE